MIKRLLTIILIIGGLLGFTLMSALTGFDMSDDETFLDYAINLGIPIAMVFAGGYLLFKKK